jgi:predicted MFS family arabinose efflux permease
VTIHHSPGHRARDRGTIVSSILLSKAAIATFSIAPFLMGGYIDHLGLSVVQASRVLSVEIFAIACSNAAAYVWLRRVNYRAVARRLLLLIVVMNVSCILSDSYGILLAQRAIIGALEGALFALGFGILGTTSRPERNFGLYFAVSLSVGALNVRVLPLFMEAAGVTGLFVNLCLYAFIALVGTFWLPRTAVCAPEDTGIGREAAQTALLSRNARAPRTAAFTLSSWPLALLLAANYLYFVGQGGVWSFLERLGRQFHLSLTDITGAISLSLLAGVAGGLTATWLDIKLGRALPLLTAIVMTVVALPVIGSFQTTIGFTAGACLYNFGNNLGHPYILGLAAKLDPTGRLTVLSGALHTGGQATGPFVIGLLVAPPDFRSALWVGFVLFCASTLLIAPAAFSDRRHTLQAACNAPAG